MTLDELKLKLPETYAPWIATYAPAFINMSAAEIQAWIEMLILGDILPAYKAVIVKLPNTDLLGQWDTINTEWETANVKNADRIALQKAAAVAVLKILLGIALAAAGF